MRWTSLAAPLLLLLCKVVSADDVADVGNAVNDLYRSLGAKDLQGLAMYVPQKGFTEFNPEHKDLQIVDLNLFKGAFDAGVLINLHVEQLRARVTGNTAIVTGYRVGSITFPDGKIVSDRQCLTMNWSKAKTWTLQHVHLSMCSA
jgi:ketosteroid isomerase-like protein